MAPHAASRKASESNVWQCVRRILRLQIKIQYVYREVRHKGLKGLPRSTVTPAV